MDIEACTLHHRIRAKNCEGWNIWKEFMGHGTYSGLGGVSIAPVGFTKITSTANTISAAVDDYEHVRRLCFHIRLARFLVVSSLSRHKSYTIPPRRLHDWFSNQYPVLDFHTSEHRHLGHEHSSHATPASPTTLGVEDTLTCTPCP
jgi:hypothetical protein